MKTDDGRFRLLDDLGRRRVERRPDWPAPADKWVEGGFGVVRRELPEPARLPLGILLRGNVAEEIDVEGRGRSPSDLGDLIAKLRRGQHCSRQRAEATRFANHRAK